MKRKMVNPSMDFHKLPTRLFDKNSFQFSVIGYNDKQDTFMLKILQRMTNFDVDSKRFEVLKEKVSTNL